MRLLWGRKTGAEPWQEQLLATQLLGEKNKFDRVKELAARDGFGHFRESEDSGAAPDFAASAKPVRRSRRFG